MSDDNGKIKQTFNIIKRRGDPTKAVTLTGHHVEKSEYVYFKDGNDDYQKVRAADYHNEHFLYIDPRWNSDDPEISARSKWFAMCTCGSKAILIGPGIGMLGGMATDQHYREMMLVCEYHQTRLMNHGKGWHQGQEKTVWM